MAHYNFHKGTAKGTKKKSSHKMPDGKTMAGEKHTAGKKDEKWVPPWLLKKKGTKKVAKKVAQKSLPPWLKKKGTK